MSSRYVLVIDAGSGGCRAFVFDLQGATVAAARRDWTYLTPADASPLGKEFDTSEFWDLICQVIKEAIGKSAINPANIAGISVASQRLGLVFLDKDGNELYAGPNTDLRALMEGFLIDSGMGRQVHRITGHIPSFLLAPAKLRWFQAQKPEIHERISTVLSIGNWIIFRLCGERVGEPSLDGDTGLLDVSSACWSDSLLATLRVPPGLCPKMSFAGTCAGKVTAAAAQQTGLVPGTCVSTGGGDTQCGLLGMGLKDAAQVGIVAGWSATLQMVTQQPVIDPAGRIWSGCHVLPGTWVLESNAAEAGGAYSWLKSLLYETTGVDSKEDAYAVMDRMAAGIAPGSEGVLAYIGPVIMDMTRLKPNLGGFIFPITPSVTAIRKEHLIRAAIENLCYAFKANCLQLEAVSGMKAAGVSVGGGLAQSRTLAQVLADALQDRVKCFDAAQITASGTAMCAATGAGVYPDLASAMEGMQPAWRLVEPDIKCGEEYERHFERWSRAVKSLEELLEEIG